MIGNKTIQTALGPISVSSLDHCITEIRFGGEKKEEILTPVIIKCCDQLEAYFKGELKEFSIAIEPQGTEFQKRVWRILNAIPYGKTRSYLDIAKEIDDPNAVRAVGSANGNNPIAIVQPCHRVIGSDGSLTGYAGGMDRKEWLLRLEKAPIASQTSLF